MQQVARWEGMGLHSGQGMGKHMHVWVLVTGGVAASGWRSDELEQCRIAAVQCLPSRA